MCSHGGRAFFGEEKKRKYGLISQVCPSPDRTFHSFRSQNYVKRAILHTSETWKDGKLRKFRSGQLLAVAKIAMASLSKATLIQFCGEAEKKRREKRRRMRDSKGTKAKKKEEQKKRNSDGQKKKRILACHVSSLRLSVCVAPFFLFCYLWIQSNLEGLTTASLFIASSPPSYLFFLLDFAS